MLLAGVEPTQRHQLVVRALLHQAAAVEHDDAVRVTDGGQSVGDHQGGVEMADAVLARTDNSQVLSLAAGIQRAQKAEIVAMQQMLAERS